MSQPPLNFAYFGGEPLGVPVLSKLIDAGLVPKLIICSPDRPVGRRQILTPPPLKVFAQEHNLSVFQPESYKDDTAKEQLSKQPWDVFVVVAYNFILPRWLLDMPRYGTVNLHPSLLPRLRGASPIRSAIWRDEPEAVGVSVMLLDEKMDHGPILAQQPFSSPANSWPISGPELDESLANQGGELLAEVLPRWVEGKITPQEQNHTNATYCGRFIKDDSLLEIDPKKLPGGEAARQTWLKINAFAGIGDTYFVHSGKRIKVKKAELTNDQLHLIRVIPEGKSEMDFIAYLNSIS